MVYSTRTAEKLLTNFWCFIHNNGGGLCGGGGGGRGGVQVEVVTTMNEVALKTPGDCSPDECNKWKENPNNKTVCDVFKKPIPYWTNGIRIILKILAWQKLCARNIMYVCECMQTKTTKMNKKKCTENILER